MKRQWQRCRGLILLTGLAAGVAVADNSYLSSSLSNAEQLKPFSGKPLEIKRATCQAEGRPEADAVMYLEDTGPFTYQIVRLEYNDQGKSMLQKGKDLPQIQKYYQKYITQQQPTNKIVFETLLGAWKLFGLKFDWEKATYHCQVTSARGKVVIQNQQ